MTEKTVIGGLDLPEKAEHTREKPIHTYRLTLYGHTITAEQRTIIQQKGDRYTGR